MAKTTFHQAATRGHANHGWLDTYHSFSFADYYDPQRIHFGALRVLNDDWVKAGFGFGKHPHDNMEIITIVLEGALEHQDSMGHKQSIHPDEVQVMSAGTGIVHGEYNHSKTEDVRLFQIWIFPKEKNVTPRYDQKVFDGASRKNQLQMLVSPMDTDDEGLKIHQDAWIYRTSLDQDKEIVVKSHNPQHGFYVMVAEGSATVNGQALERRDALGISDVEALNIRANAASDIIILEIPMLA